ncbi:DUF397 domain-containing protein [Nocardia camponoti]|uniref:DUF397 domain-containing protein n=1 Tax=Nocardia camponoti TaxID=1616106 RepID=A0A917QJW7_9NOCA|nr:DUF397 domain-containing protein [Nocardia camponoti]GGK54094.1 DUF397 domain-containing protein [Nocardia camponoti]
MNAKRDIDTSEAVWRRAGDTGVGSVEVAMLADGHVGLRDSRDPDGPVLIFTPSEWVAFTAGVNDGEFDKP